MSLHFQPKIFYKVLSISGHLFRTYLVMWQKFELSHLLLGIYSQETYSVQLALHYFMKFFESQATTFQKYF